MIRHPDTRTHSVIYIPDTSVNDDSNSIPVLLYFPLIFSCVPKDSAACIPTVAKPYHPNVSTIAATISNPPFPTHLPASYRGLIIFPAVCMHRFPCMITDTITASIPIAAVV